MARGRGILIFFAFFEIRWFVSSRARRRGFDKTNIFAPPQEEKLSREQDDAIQNDAPLPDQGGGTESTRYHEGRVKSSSYSPHKYKIAL